MFLLLVLTRGFFSALLPPAELPASSHGVRILLGEGFPDPGVHQFSDATTLLGVIELTGLSGVAAGSLTGAGDDQELVDGMALAMAASHGVVELGWMPARQRLALGIPLHPDRMSHDDWVTLPGIGEKMAVRIEEDRQKYGDFGSVDALERVKGIGPAKLKQLRPFFDEIDK